MSWTKIWDDPDYRLTFSDCVELERVMEENKIVLSPRDAEVIFDLMENPPEPSEALIEAARRARGKISRP